MENVSSTDARNLRSQSEFSLEQECRQRTFSDDNPKQPSHPIEYAEVTEAEQSPEQVFGITGGQIEMKSFTPIEKDIGITEEDACEREVMQGEDLGVVSRDSEPEFGGDESPTGLHRQTNTHKHLPPLRISGDES